MVWYWISNVRTKKSTVYDYEAYYGEGLSREYELLAWLGSLEMSPSNVNKA